MSTTFWLRSVGYLKLLSQLEGIVGDCVQNNGRPIRYPIDWPDGNRLRGKNIILRAASYTFDEMSEGRYVFGANELLVYQALDKILKHLAVRMADPSSLYDLIDLLNREETGAEAAD